MIYLFNYIIFILWYQKRKKKKLSKFTNIIKDSNISEENPEENKIKNNTKLEKENTKEDNAIVVSRKVSKSSFEGLLLEWIIEKRIIFMNIITLII